MKRNVLIRREEVLRRTGIRTTTLYRLMASCEFPAQVKIGGGKKNPAVAWVESEVDEWIAMKIANREVKTILVGGARIELD